MLSLLGLRNHAVCKESTGCSRKKTCTQFAHYNFATVCHKIMLFSAKCSERNCLHARNQCLNTAIKYSLFHSWQVNYLKTKLTAKSLKIRGINKSSRYARFQNSEKRCSMCPPRDWITVLNEWYDELSSDFRQLKVTFLLLKCRWRHCWRATISGQLKIYLSTR